MRCNKNQKKKKAANPVRMDPHSRETELWNDLSNFVEKMCKGRDESHGHGHMKKVAESSIKIFQEVYGQIDDQNREKFLKTIAVAWLHDVADHKYDPKGLLTGQIKNFS